MEYKVRYKFPNVQEKGKLCCDCKEKGGLSLSPFRAERVKLRAHFIRLVCTFISP